MSASEEVVIWARLAGTRQFLANAGLAGAAVRDLGIETETAGMAMERTSRRGYLMNQALFTVRRLMYGTTLAVLGAGVAAVKFGWDFNSAMQQARVALSPVFKDTASLNSELDYLFNFTKYTPFQFKDVTIAFRQMYAAFQPLGIGVDTTNKTIAALVDSLAYAGKTTPGNLNRVAIALQHMAYQGHLTGYAVNQLARDGIPMMAILRKEFGLTGEQIHNVGKLGIPTIDVLKAIIAYIGHTPGFMNAAHRQAVGTFHGLFTTFKDNTGQIMGAVETGFFHHIQHNLEQMNSWFDTTTMKIKQSSGSASDVIRAIDPAAVPLWHQVATDVHLLWVNFRNLVGSFVGSQMVWGTIYLGLVLLHGILVLLVPLTQTFGWYLNILVPLFIVWYTYTKLTAFWTGVLAIEEILATKATKDLSFAQFLLAVATGRFMIMARLATFATALYVYAQVGATIATDAFSAAMVRARAYAAALWLVMELNPIVLILTAIILLTAGLVILYFKWKWFHDEVNHTFNWLVNQSPLVSAALMLAFGPLGIALETLILIKKYWDELQGFWSWLNTGSGSPNQAGVPPGARMVPKGMHPKKVDAGFFAGMGIQGMAGGGTVRRGGLSWVGENGPELLSLPAGATVTPNQDSKPIYNLMESWMKAQGEGRQMVHATFKIGRKVLLDAVAEGQATAEARA